MATRTEQFLSVKKCLRIHKDWTDEQVAEYCGIRLAAEGDIIREARKDLKATDSEEGKAKLPDAPWLQGMM